MNSVKNKTIGILFIIYILYGISSTIIDPIIPILSERLNIGFDKIGLILLLGSIFALISTFITGRFCDRFNLKKIILAGIILSVIGLLLFTIYLSILIFVFVIIFIRLGQGNLDSSVHAYTARIFYKEHSPIFMKMDIFWFIGALIGPLMIGIALLLEIDIKIVFLILAVFYLILLISFYRVSPKNELELVKTEEAIIPGTKLTLINSLNNYETNSNYTANIGESNSDNTYSKRIMKSTFSVLKNPIIIISCFILLFFQGVVSGLSSWLTTYFTSLNVPVTFGSVILSFFWAFSAFGLFLNMKIIEKGKGNDISILLLSILLGVASTIIYSFVPIVYLKIIFLMLQALFYSTVFPLTISIAVHENPEFGGTILGASIAFSVAGSIMFQPLLGFTAQYFGKSSVVYILILTSVITLIFIFILFTLIKKKYNLKFKIH